MTQHPHDLSLSDVHQSVDTEAPSKPVWKRLLSFFGPAYLISVGYMDPGNWATDLAGGSQFGYTLIWVLLMSNLMALLLQNLSAKLGIVRGRDLAQANRETYPPYINFCLYLLAEIAIAACDLAEVLGMAIGLQLLTGLPLLYAVLLTVLDTFLLLVLQKLGMRKMEAFIICLIGIIGLSFLIEIILAKPDIHGILSGFKPSIPNDSALYIAVGIIGATIMPHNLYLHSALVQTRKIKRDHAGIKRALKLNIIDSTIALNLAFFVNAAILILAASVFYERGMKDVGDIKQAHLLLRDLLGTKLAPYLFAIALIASGQSSTITGTLAGQIVMEGYLKLRINPWMRRLLTRLIAILPAVLVILISGEKEVNSLIVLSQVVLSIQLGFAVIPLIHFVSDKETMGRFVIKPVIKVLAWSISVVLIFFNTKMVAGQAYDFFKSSNSLFWKCTIIISSLFFIALLIAAFIYPILKKKAPKRSVHLHPSLPLSLDDIKSPLYERIALSLDFSQRDRKILMHAISQASEHASLILIHIVESAPSRILGIQTDDFETRADQEKLDVYAEFIRQKGLKVETYLGFNNRQLEIPRLVKLANADMLIIGAHGHRGVKDWLYGETIDAVRHQLKIPVLIV